MGNLRHLIVATATAAILGGCAGVEYKDLSVTGSEFDRELYNGYRMLADGEWSEADERDANAFGMRAVEAAKGNRPAPEAIAARKLPADKVGELSGAREKLVAALAKGAADKVAKDAAMAQVSFDCWMQEQEENIQPADIAKCRKDFDRAMARIDASMMKPVATAAPVAKKMRKPETTTYVVYFDFDSAKLDKQAKDALSLIKGEAKPGAKIMIRAHADRAGAAEYNNILAAKRAKSVFSTLEAEGVKGELETEVYGEERTAIRTKDGVREKLNRRVEILVTQ